MKLRIALFCLLWVVAPVLLAQGPLYLGGYVLEGTGSAVSGVPVLLRDSSGSVIAQTVSDASGYFRFASLSPGKLVVDVPAYAGFAEREQPVQLATSIASLKIKLALASVSQQVTVAAEQEQLSTDSGANRDAVAVTASQLRKLPAIDGDYVAALSSFLDASSTSSGGVTLVVDGVEMKSAGVAPSAIQEVRINNDPYAVEFRSPGRGRIEITTKPGTQDFHGEGDFLYRDGVLDGRNYFAQTRPLDHRVLFQGHLTGPVANAKHTNFIVSGSYRWRNPDVAVNALGPNGPIDETVTAPNKSSQATGRVTHDFSDAHRLQIGYNFEYYAENNSGIGALVLPEAGYNDQSREDDLIFNDRIILTPNLIDQLLVTFEKDEDATESATNARSIQADAVCKTAQSIQVSGALTCGGAQADLARTENTVHVNEVVSWNRGNHYLRFGVQLPQFSRRAVDDRTNRLGTYSFGSLAAYNSRIANTYTVQQGAGRGLYWIDEFGAFVQDQIKLTPRLQISLGVRYDWQTFLDDRNNFAPRVSLAYAPRKGHTILRAGSGFFYDRTGGDFPAIVKLHDGTVLDTLQIENTPYPYAGSLSAVPSNIARFAPGVVAPYMVQSSIGIEHQITKKLTASATYRNSVQVKSFRSRDVNAPVLPPNPNPAVTYPRPNSGFGQIQQIEATGRQLVNALDLSLRGDAGRWFSGQAQYTLSRAWNNTGGIRSFPANQYDPNADWGRANFDRLHAFDLEGEFNSDHWLSLGVNLALNSGTPYTETTGNDDYQTGLFNARPAGVARNTLQAGGQISLDLQWSHDFRLGRATGDKARYFSAGVGAFNVLNHTNFDGYVGALSSPLFGQPTSAMNPRQMQLSVGYRF